VRVPSQLDGWIQVSAGEAGHDMIEDRSGILALGLDQ
jgi:hypothetical protein